MISDPRTIVLPFMASPILVPMILASYLYFVTQCGPRYMKDKKPYDLKTFVKYYNIFQVITNAWIVQRLLSVGLVTEISVICTPMDFTYDPIPLKVFKEHFLLCRYNHEPRYSTINDANTFLNEAFSLKMNETFPRSFSFFTSYMRCVQLL